MDKQTFIEEIESLGAVKPGNLSYDYKFEIEGNELSVSPRTTNDGDLWVHARWDDPKRAVEILEDSRVSPKFTGLNVSSGKWNSLNPELWLEKLRKVLKTEQEK